MIQLPAAYHSFVDVGGAAVVGWILEDRNLSNMFKTVIFHSLMSTKPILFVGSTICNCIAAATITTVIYCLPLQKEGSQQPPTFTIQSCSAAADRKPLAAYGVENSAWGGGRVKQMVFSWRCYTHTDMTRHCTNILSSYNLIRILSLSLSLFLSFLFLSRRKTCSRLWKEQETGVGGKRANSSSSSAIIQRGGGTVEEGQGSLIGQLTFWRHD
jgi:hypothetical protein